MKYYLLAFKKYAPIYGRSNRSEYWYFVLFHIIFAIVALDPRYNNRIQSCRLTLRNDISALHTSNVSSWSCSYCKTAYTIPTNRAGGY